MTLSDLAGAITRMEGSCSAPGVCRNNNPGNLRAYAAGQPVDTSGLRIFPDFASGQAALLSQEQLNISKGLTLDEFFGGKGTCPGPACVYPGYAPAGADSNNPSVYAGNVSSWLGVPRDVPLSSLMGGSSDVPYTGGTAATLPGMDPGYPDSTSVASDGESLSPIAWAAIAVAGAAALWAIA